MVNSTLNELKYPPAVTVASQVQPMLVIGPDT